jgi:AcrR family transcriptional regulator
VQVLKEEIRKKILAVAETLFYQKGFRETTTREIAAAVGISVSNLYLYYQNKEAVFQGVIDGFYHYFINSMKTFLDHHDRNNSKDVELGNYLRQIILADQKRFVILTAKSQGTQYEGFRQQIISNLIKHIKEQVDKDLVSDDLIIYILAKNFIEGITEIAKNYHDDLSLTNCINTLVKYHMSGMKPLM